MCMNQTQPEPTTIENEVELNESDDVASKDPRHQKRIDLMQALFAYSFGDDMALVDSTHVEEIGQIISDLTEIDTILTTAAPERPLTEVNKVDLAILRLIMFESRHKKTPKKVLLDESVELAKEFGTESSPAFVNGVLGKLLGDTSAN